MLAASAVADAESGLAAPSVALESDAAVDLRRAIAAAAVSSPASATSRPSDVSSAASSLPPFLRNFLGILTPATCFGSRALLFLPIPASFRSTTRYYKMAYYLYRSEEHTSELQSLMRISYAVFCLKKTNNHTVT